MKASQGTTSAHLLFCIIALYLVFSVEASSDSSDSSICADVKWQPGQFMKRELSDSNSNSTPTSTASSSGSISSSSPAPVPVIISPLIATGQVTAGELVCRFTDSTEGLDINYYTCTLLANTWGITVEKFFDLNPGLAPDCSNIQADTEYCVQGFIEPLRATDGLCGPPNKNATCLGTGLQCCNGNTFTCGNSTEDCAPGNCYEGACYGDSVYTTTGQCGRQHGYRQCAGVWGDCCNADGKCGTGPSYCGVGMCQLGNCTIPAVAGLPPLSGNNTAGTCGGTNALTCDGSYGRCCNKNGMCGSLLSDCGPGCQPQFGTCNSSTTSPSSSKSSSKAASTSSVLKTSAPTTTSVPQTSSSAMQTSTSTIISSPSTSIPGEAALPSCGQLCFNNMLAQYSTLGCNALDGYCLCNNVNFGYGLRDCSNGACGTAVGSTIIAFGSSYCNSAIASHTATATATGLAALPSCGQTCFNNMLAQYSSLGCTTPAPACLCSNVNFSYGIRDCSNAACGTVVASKVIDYGGSYCRSATATATVH
ncbi:carbohydrate-binding module family 18 protein [Stipitochalara longipes BDJ]|nr:carbohydrate-binding module family 18 protein [Stipitochalara longipes BDJ]